MNNKLLSRKLGVTIATILSVVFQIDDHVRAGVAGAVAIAYVVAQALVDKAQVQKIVAAAEEGLADAVQASSAQDATK